MLGLLVIGDVHFLILSLVAANDVGTSIIAYTSVHTLVESRFLSPMSLRLPRAIDLPLLVLRFGILVEGALVLMNNQLLVFLHCFLSLFLKILIYIYNFEFEFWLLNHNEGQDYLIDFTF